MRSRVEVTAFSRRFASAAPDWTRYKVGLLHDIGDRRIAKNKPRFGHRR
jgi:hypothetical protein